MSAHGRRMDTDEEPIAEISSPSPAVERKNCMYRDAAMFDAALGSSMSYVVIFGSDKFNLLLSVTGN